MRVPTYAQNVLLFLWLLCQFYEETIYSLQPNLHAKPYMMVNQKIQQIAPLLFSTATDWSVSYSEGWVICTVMELNTLRFICNQYSLTPHWCANPLHHTAIVHWWDVYHWQNISYIYVKPVYAGSSGLFENFDLNVIWSVVTLSSASTLGKAVYATLHLYPESRHKHRVLSAIWNVYKLDRRLHPPYMHEQYEGACGMVYDR